ncbi:MAG: plastocyanin/azurin family copper-binding protein [Caldilineaceae bacterium]
MRTLPKWGFTISSMLLMIMLSLIVAACQTGLAEPIVVTVVVTATPTAAAIGTPESAMTETITGEMKSEMDDDMVMSAAMLRATLDGLFGEHVILAANATDAALHGRSGEFEAAAAALDHNSEDIAGAVELVYGQGAADAFLPLWRRHIGFFVDYTTAVAQGDEAARMKALDELTGYVEDFGAFLESANPNLTKAAVKSLLGPHVGTLTAVIDAQATDDYPAAFMHLREAYVHMDMIAGALAGAIGQQFPDKFPGAADTAGANLRSTLSQLLAEHVALAAMATDAAVNGREAAFQAGAEALDHNTIDLAAAVGSVYGQGAGDALLPLWRTHIGFFVDYTLGAASGNAEQKAKALADLQGYREDFAAFLISANPNLSKEMLVDALTPHVATLTATIDAQAAGNPSEAYMHFRMAYAHMSVIANALSDAIIAQFPAQFPGQSGDAMMGMMDEAMDHTMTMHDAMTNTMANTGAMADTEVMTETMAHETPQAMDAMQGDMVMSAAYLRAAFDLLLSEHVALAASATDAAFRGRTAEFEAAAAALDGNSMDIAATVGSVYGQAAADAFLALWRKHIGFFVDYTMAVAQGNEDARQQALVALDGYAEDFGAFIESANPYLPKAAVAKLLREHVATLTAVIGAQGVATIHASGDQMTVYPALRMAFAHMDMEAMALAMGIAQQFPDKFPGAADSAAANLRSALNQLQAEHALLLIKAADAALHARNIEYEAAFAALDANTVDLANAVGSVYGQAAGDAFLPLWRKHIGFFMDYALASIEGNEKTKQQAADALMEYSTDFGAFIHSANPNLPVAAVAALADEHVHTTLAAIDASAADQPDAYYAALRKAFAHMGMIANGLSDAIIAQFPDQFNDEPMDMASQETIGEDPVTPAAMAEGATTEDAMMEQTATDATAVNDVMLTIPVNVSMFTFQPARIEVPVGATVVWINRDAIDHTVTSGAPNAPTALFDSGFFDQGEQFAVTFERTGEFPYFCRRHPQMRGVIIVK